MAEDADILAGLYGLREVPPGIADVVAAVAIGLLLAGALGLAISAFRGRSGHASWSDKIAAAQRLPEPQRTLRLAVLLREITDRVAPGAERWTQRAAVRFGFDRAEIEALGEALYQPGTAAPDRLTVLAEQAARMVRD